MLLRHWTSLHLYTFQDYCIQSICSDLVSSSSWLAISPFSAISVSPLHSGNIDHITAQIVTNQMECQCYAVNAKRIPNSVLTRFNTAILRHLLFEHCCFGVVLFFVSLNCCLRSTTSHSPSSSDGSHRSSLMVRNSQSRKINGLFTPESTIYRDVLDFLTWEKLLSQVWLGCVLWPVSERMLCVKFSVILLFLLLLLLLSRSKEKWPNWNEPFHLNVRQTRCNDSERDEKNKNKMIVHEACFCLKEIHIIFFLFVASFIPSSPCIHFVPVLCGQSRAL